jgi:hypothetical protein
MLVVDSGTHTVKNSVKASKTLLNKVFTAAPITLILSFLVD